jgi:hypothetical protein
MSTGARVSTWPPAKPTFTDLGFYLLLRVIALLFPSFQ